MATLVVVRRDAIRTFEHLRATLAPTLGSDLELMWDRRTSDRRRYDLSVPVERRVGERRAGDVEVLFLDESRRGEQRQQLESRRPERRQAERRRRLPDTWRTLGFVVVAGEARTP